MTNTIYDHPEDYDDQYADYTKDIPFWIQIAKWYRFYSLVLEFACGTGRVTLELAKASIPVYGVDLSEQMLNLAIKKRNTQGLRHAVKLFHGDMCDFQSERLHSLVIVSFTSFLHLAHEEHLNALKNMYANLMKGGHLLVDIFNPDPSKLNHPMKPQKEVMLPEKGIILKRLHKSTYDQSTLTSLWEFHCKVYKIDSAHDALPIREYSERATVSIIYPNQWRALLETAGFEIVEEWGDFERNPFNQDSPRMLFLAKKV